MMWRSPYKGGPSISSLQARQFKTRAVYSKAPSLGN